MWEGTVAYEAEVALPSPVRRYDPEAALGESALYIVRPTPLYLFIYSPVVRRTGGGTVGRTVKTASSASYRATSTVLEHIAYVHFQTPVYFVG
jgi:hypothetical protein